ncbi:MAG: hypothetical protein V2A71_06850, partial [Candidatus Eisenbacteria bacterium]
AYTTQQKGGPKLPANDWFDARVDVVDDSVTVYVNETAIFTKKLTYYLKKGRPGFYVGTGTDASFRRVEIEDLPESSD